MQLLNEVGTVVAIDEMGQVVTQRPREVGAARHMVEVLRLHVLLVSLTMVEVVEVGDYDGHRKSNREHTSDSAQRADNLPPDSDGPAQTVNNQQLSRGVPVPHQAANSSELFCDSSFGFVSKLLREFAAQYVTA